MPQAEMHVDDFFGTERVEALNESWAEDAAQSRKGGKKRSRKIPQPGEQGYRTPTQLRNARKRKAQKLSKETTRKKHNAEVAKTSARNFARKSLKAVGASADPSMQYFEDPYSAPVVRKARLFFEKRLGCSRKVGVSSEGDPARCTSRRKGEFRISLGPKERWRTVSKLAVRKGRETNCDTVEIGLFKPRSHQVIPISSCLAHHASINDTVSLIKEACIQCDIEPYYEGNGSGKLRFVAINVERSTGKVQITLVWNGLCPTSPEKQNDDGRGCLAFNDRPLSKLVKTIIRMKDEAHSPAGKKRGGNAILLPLHSLWVNFNSAWRHSNAIFSTENESWVHVYGLKSIEERITLGTEKIPYDVPLKFPPNVFRQANLDSFAQIVGKIRRRLWHYISQSAYDGSDMSCRPNCVELYGGVGTIGLHVADLFSRLTSSDENPNNLHCFNESLSHLPSEVRNNVSYCAKNAATMVCDGALDDAHVCIVDPPRKGLDKEVVDALTRPYETKATGRCGPRVLVYVSCGFDAFTRDCDHLVKAQWVLEDAEGFLLFPGSDAIECLAFFVRNQ